MGNTTGKSGGREMGTRIVQVDAFADRPFTGNPAGVCLLVDQPEDRWMQAVAGEMNLAETAFLRRVADGFALRWFTPTAEVDLCGHATLASAHHLWESGVLAPELTARFHTRSGLLTACRRDDRIEMDFPADPPEPMDPPRGLLEALGAEPIWCGKGRFDWLVQLATEAEVRELVPDLGAVERLADRGLIVTSEAAGGEADFVSRFFAPAVGVPEDPVTGSTLR